MEFPPPGNGSSFQNGLLPPDYGGQTAHYVSYEYQDIIGRLVKLEMMFAQHLSSSDEIKNLISGIETRILESVTSKMQNLLHSMQINLTEMIDARLSSSSSNSQHGHSFQQEDQLSTPIFSHKATSLPHKVSISESHGQETLFDPLDIPTFNFSSLTGDNFEQKQDSRRALSTQNTPRSFPAPTSNKSLDISRVPHLKSLKNRSMENEVDTKAAQISSKVTPFQTFYSNDAVHRGLEDGSLFIGVLSISKKNRQEASAFIETETGPLKVFILGENARNRSLEGDSVVIKLNDKAQWEPKKKSGKSIIPYKVGSPEYSEWKPKKNLISSVAQSPDLFQEFIASQGVQSFAAVTSKHNPSQKSPENKLPVSNDSIPTGVVVAILNDESPLVIKVRSITKRAGQLLVGSLVPRYGFDNPKLTKNEPLPKSENTVEFRPLDNRFPFLMIQREELPKQFIQNPFSFKSPTEKLVVCSIRGWFENFRFPLGRFVKVIGNSYNVVAETEALIKETNCSANTESFDEKLLDHLSDPTDSGRIDLRTENLFAITSDFESIQTAFHCKYTSNDESILEIGVHIADVASYIQENTPLDLETFKRTQKISLVNATFPLIPPKLSHNICSLLPGQDRLCFSVIFHISKTGELVDSNPTLIRTIVSNKAILSPDTAMNILNETHQQFNVVGKTPQGLHVAQNVSKPAILAALKLFLSAGEARHTSRYSSGIDTLSYKSDGKSVPLRTTKSLFSLHKSGEPVKITSSSKSRVKEILEEYDCIANYFVAEHLVSHGSQYAFLLKQNPPEIDEENILWQLLCLYGLPDPRSSQLSQESFVKVFENIKTGNIVEPLKASEDASSKLLPKLIHNFSNMDPQLAFALLSYLFKKALPVAEFSLPQSTSLAINGTVEHIDGHWLNNVPYYTSFTKPFDLYSNIVVQRLILLTLNQQFATKRNSPDFIDDLQHKLNIIAKKCNIRMLECTEATRRSDMLFLCSLLRKRAAQKNFIETTAVVTQFGQKNIYLYLKEYDIVCKVNVFVDWHADSAITTYCDGSFLQYKTDNKDESKIIEPPRELIEKAKGKAGVAIKLKFSKYGEVDMSYGLVIKIFLKPQVERKRILGFRTEFVHIVNKNKHKQEDTRT